MDIPPQYLENLALVSKMNVQNQKNNGVPQLTAEQAKRLVQMEATTLVVKQLNVVCAILYVVAYGWFAVASFYLGFMLAGPIGIVVVSVVQIGFLLMCAKAIGEHAKNILEMALKKFDSPAVPVTP